MIVSAFERWRARRGISDTVRAERRAWTAALSVIESIVLPAGFIAISLWLHPIDPFWVHAGFPWAWLAPFVIALRYGFVLGTISTAVLLGLWFDLPLIGALAPESGFPREYFLGGWIVILIAGEFADVWNLRLRRASASARYLEERLRAITKNHFLLRLSHERIEHELLTRPATLRETLFNLRTITRAAVDDPSPLPGAQPFLQLLAQSCQIEVASLHAIEDGRFKREPLATLGTPKPLETRNAMLNECLAFGELVHLLSAEQAAAPIAATGALVETPGVADAETYLVCAPLTSASGERIGALTVERMSFFALNDDNLRLLSTLVGYYADGVASASAIAPIQSAFPQCPDEFALELVRLTFLRADAGLDSALVALEFPHGDAYGANALLARDLFDLAKRLPRQIDLTWSIEAASREVLIVLLPLSGTAGAEGFLARVESVLMAQFGVGLASTQAFAHQALLSDTPPVRQLHDMLVRCRVLDAQAEVPA